MKYNVIAVEGEYYSGAVEVGNRLSEKLGIACYTSDVIQTAAACGHTSVRDLERLKETTDSRLLHDVYTKQAIGRIPYYNRRTLDTEIEILHRLADIGPYIIVESGFPKSALAKLKVFTVFIYTSFHARIQYAVQRQVDASLQHAMRITKRHDRLMARRYEMYSDFRWADHKGYDMVLDSEELGFDGCAGAIAAVIKETSA